MDYRGENGTTGDLLVQPGGSGGGNSGHHLRPLFFEETEKDELPMKSLPVFRKTLLAAVIGAAALAPSPLLACAACYGKSDSPLANGMNWGIFTLLGVVLTVLTCILVFFVHIVRKEEKVEQQLRRRPIHPTYDAMVC